MEFFVIDDEFDEQMDMQSFFPRIRSQSEIKDTRLEELSKKPISELTSSEIFDLINANVNLDNLIPEALNLIERRAFINIVNPNETEFSILSRCHAYFKKRPAQKKKFEQLKLWDKNSRNCIDPKSKKIREGFNNKQDAQQYALYNNLTVTNQCDNCGKWHVVSAPKCDYCNKQLYPTEEAALRIAEIRMQDGTPQLRAYECTRQIGWHLTSHV